MIMGRPNLYFQKIEKKNLCIGCGMCEALYEGNVKMELSEDGFFKPVLKNIEKNIQYAPIRKVCPGINIQIGNNSNKKEKGVWGKILSVYKGNSTHQETRLKASSGGIISELAAFLLEEGIVNGVLQVGGDENNYTKNELKVSRSRNDVISCASSRYAPAVIFSEIVKIFEREKNDKFCFVGKPCDISGLCNFLEVYPQYKNRIVLTIGIFCAGLPSFNATKKLIDSFNPKLPIKGLKYRGNGWPGYFSFQDFDEEAYKMTYNDSWGKVLGKNIHMRCKICPDGIGLQADLAVGDAWDTKDGYPDFAEKEGESLIASRTEVGEKILQEAFRLKYINIEKIDESNLRKMQPYQYNRRIYVGVRILAYMIAKVCVLNFKGLSLYNNTKKAEKKRLIHEFLGTIKRSIKK